MLNIAIVGLGGIGNTHARCYGENPKTTVVAVCDIDKRRADKPVETYDAKSFYSAAEMLNAGLTIDAASVATAGVENGADHFQNKVKALGSARAQRTSRFGDARKPDAAIEDCDGPACPVVAESSATRSGACKLENR